MYYISIYILEKKRAQPKMVKLFVRLGDLISNLK